MSVKVNKKSLKQQGGQAMIPEGPAMMDMPLQPQQPQVDPEVMQIAQAIKQGVEEGKDLMMIIKGLMAQELEQDLIGQALMMGGMEEEDVITIFETVNTPPEPSSPQEVDTNPQLLARNKEIERRNQEEAEKAQQEEEMVDVSEMVREVGKVTEAKSGIEIKPENRGKFTAWAKKRGMGVQEAARKVLANKSKYPPSVVKMANFARNASKWNKQEGGETVDDYYLDKDGNVDIQELDEVVVTADNRSPLQKLSDYAFVNEDDNFLTKAIKNQYNPLLQIDNILQASSIPANLVREIIEGTTDKGDGQFNAGNILPDFYNTTILTGDDKQIPVSETLGIDNWAGALATDMALDPLSYAGAGIVRNLGTKAAKNLAPKLAKFLGNTTKNLKRAPLLDEVFKDVSDDVVNDLIYKGEINDYLKQYGRFENESVLDILDNPEVPSYVKDELLDLQYFKSGNIPGRGPVELRKVLEDSGLDPDNFKEGGEFKPHFMYKGNRKIRAKDYETHLRLKEAGYTHDKPKAQEGVELDERSGKTINGVYIPSDEELENNTLSQNLQQPNNFYTPNRGMVIAPGMPEPTSNVLFDFLNTATRINEDLFDQDLDETGNRKGAFLDIFNRGEGISINNPFKKGDKIQLTKGNPNPDGPSKMDFYNVTKPLYYNTEITNLDELTSEENQKAYADWAMQQTKEWQEATQKQQDIENRTIAETQNTTVEEIESGPDTRTFEEWAQDSGYNLDELSETVKGTLMNLWKKTLKLKKGGGVNNPGFKALPPEAQHNILSNMSKGGEESYLAHRDKVIKRAIARQEGKAQFGFSTPGFNPYTDDFAEYIQKGMQTNYMEDLMNTVPPRSSQVDPNQQADEIFGDDGVVVTPNQETQQPTADELFERINTQPEMRVTNKAEGFLNRMEDSPIVDALSAGANALVLGSAFGNRIFDRRINNEIDDQIDEQSGADYKFRTLTSGPFSLGKYQANSGQLQGEGQRVTGYQMAFPGSPGGFVQKGKEIMKTGGQVVELSQDMIAQLIAAGADIEIL
jgi:hypothetical protein